MARALDLLVVQSEIVNAAGAAIKNYEKFDLEATTAALFCLYDIDTRYADKLVCAKIINLLFTHLPQRDNILAPVIRVISRSDQDDRWKIAANMNKKYKRDELVNKLNILMQAVHTPATTTTTTTAPATAVVTTTITTTSSAPTTTSATAVVSSSAREDSKQTGIITSSSSTAPTVSVMTTTTVTVSSSSTIDHLKLAICDLDKQLAAEQYSQEEKQAAMTDLQQTGVDDVEGQWRYALQRMVAAILRLKFDDPKLNLRVREEYTGSNNALKRSEENELGWAKRVEQECRASMWLCNLWKDRGMSEIDTEQIGKSFYRIFVEGLTAAEWMVWRNFDMTSFADIMERIVAKCRSDVNVRPADGQSEMFAMTAAARRGRERPLRKTRVEGKYSETKQESMFAAKEEESEEEKNWKKKKNSKKRSPKRKRQRKSRWKKKKKKKRKR